MQVWLVIIPVLVVVSVLGLLARLWALESHRPRLICLMYHRLASQEEYARQVGTERIFAMPAENLERQIAWLKQAGYTFVTAEQARLFVSGQLELAQPAVMLTFDDGSVSVDRVARPILERHGARATVFVTTDPQSYVFKLGEGTDRRLSDDELRAADGKVLTFESHGLTHRPLRGLSDRELRLELTESKRQLEKVLSRSVDYLAIPGNWYSRRVMRMAREVGYQAVWYSNPGTARIGSRLFGLPRVNVEGQLTLPQFIGAVAPLGVANRRLLAAVKRVPHRLLGPRYWLPIRKVILRCVPGHHLSMRRMLAMARVVAVLGLLAILGLLFLSRCLLGGVFPDGQFGDVYRRAPGPGRQACAQVGACPMMAPSCSGSAWSRGLGLIQWRPV